MGRRGDRRGTRRGAAIGASIGAVVLIGTAIGLVNMQGGTFIPTGGGGDTLRIDLLASRDLEVNGDLPAGGTTDTKPPASAQSWTRTGGESCYPISTTDASCFTSSEVPYTYAATTIDSVAYTLGFPVEPSATNRILYSTAIDCTNWTCGGAPTVVTGVTAPDGSATASTITVTNVNKVYKGAVLYSGACTLYPRVWVKCSSGTLNIESYLGQARGKWAIDCSAVAGSWTLINQESTAKTEVYAWTIATGTTSGVNFVTSGASVTASVWAPTLTEEPGTGLAVIPTGAAAVSTGDPAWAIDNTSGAYYVAGDAVTQTLSEITGTCWAVDGTDLLLSGASGSPCAGIWYALQVAP